MADVTGLLAAYGGNHREALVALAPVVYDELRRIAHRKLQGEAAGHTLQTTGLVHEAFLKFHEAESVQVQDRTHFFALSARMMRHILLDHAKRRRAQKRGGDRDLAGLEEASAPPSDASDRSVDQLIALDEALDQLAARSARQAQVVEYRFFAGMSVEETAEALDVSRATVKRDWQFARAWLNRALA